MVVVDASPVAAPDTREVPDLSSACARMDVWDLSEVAKALCGAVGTCIKSQGRPVGSCSRCAPALEAISAVHCQERNEINNNRKEIRD